MSVTGTTDLPQVTDADFATTVPAADRPVLVQFTAAWCGSCRMMKPVLAALAKDMAGEVDFVSIDVDHQPETTARYGVMSMPTLILFDGGEPVMQVVGARSGRKLTAEIREALGTRGAGKAREALG